MNNRELIAAGIPRKMFRDLKTAIVEAIVCCEHYPTVEYLRAVANLCERNLEQIGELAQIDRQSDYGNILRDFLSFEYERGVSCQRNAFKLSGCGDICRCRDCVKRRAKELLTEVGTKNVSPFGEEGDIGEEANR